MRYKFKATAYYSSFKYPKIFSGPAFSVYGSVMIDWASFGDDAKTRRANSGYSGFVIGVECLSHQLCVVPVKSKNMQSWQRAVQTMCETSIFERVNVLISDRDAVATSSSFRQRLKRVFGVHWIFLPVRQKAFLAER
jgi:hypothetical protein